MIEVILKEGTLLMCIYGYCRISTKQKSIDRQIRNIKGGYDKTVIIQEVYTGTKQDIKNGISCIRKPKQEIPLSLIVYHE